MRVTEVTARPGHLASCLPVVAGVGAGQQMEGQPGQLWCQQREHHMLRQPPWPRQRETGSVSFC